MKLGDALPGDARHYSVTLPCSFGDYESVKQQAATALLNSLLDAGEFPAATVALPNIEAQYNIQCETGPLGQLPHGRVLVMYDVLEDRHILRADCLVRSIW